MTGTARALSCCALKAALSEGGPTAPKGRLGSQSMLRSLYGGMQSGVRVQPGTLRHIVLARCCAMEQPPGLLTHVRSYLGADLLSAITSTKNSIFASARHPRFSGLAPLDGQAVACQPSMARRMSRRCWATSAHIRVPSRVHMHNALLQKSTVTHVATGVPDPKQPSSQLAVPLHTSSRQANLLVTLGHMCYAKVGLG